MADFLLPQEGQEVVFKGFDHMDKKKHISKRKAVFNGQWFLHKDEAFLPDEVEWWRGSDGKKHENPIKKMAGYERRTPVMTEEERKFMARQREKRWRKNNPEKYQAQLDRQKEKRRQKKAAKAAGTA
jgi:hypothetical protein